MKKSKTTYNCFKLRKILIIAIAVFVNCCLGTEDVSAEENETSYKTEVGKYGMIPIYAQDVSEGDYDILVDSNSPFFKITHATLKVSNGEMKADITIGSHSYLHVFMGTKKEADDNEAEWINPVEDGDSYIFSVPVEALNKPIDCAAYSKRKKKWYDRKILFDASSLPKEVISFELPDYDAIARGLELLEADDGENSVTAQAALQKVYGEYTGRSAYESAEAMEVPYEDGEYSIEVSMAGGTGRVTVSSPTLLIVKDGRAYAKVLFSSSYYDWMLVGGNTYLNENTEGGNSYFIIPVPDMDSIVPVIADTTAMGDPVAIEYSLTFYADTIGNKGQIPQEAAKKVILAAGILIAAGGILNILIKRKRKGK